MTHPHHRRLWTTAASTFVLLAVAATVPVGASAAPAARAASAARSTPARSAAARSAALPARTPIRVGRPCVHAAPPRRWDHVVWIVMENHSSAQVLGTRATPFENSLARQCGRALTYTAATHPSLPNYLVLTSGSAHGVRDDTGPSAHPIRGASIFSLAAAARRGWATFVESMPAHCDARSGGFYAGKHNPALYYTTLRRSCPRYDLPMGSPRRGPLASALARRTLPAFTLLVPNLCHDDHDCAVSAGDAWLHAWIDTIVASPTYRAGRTAVFVTWDENDGRAGNQVALLAIAPSIRPGTLARGRFGHTALLHTTLQMLGLRDPLTPRAPSMRRAFRI